MFDLTGRAALVTGGGYGIGRSICEAMAEFGADVAIGDINEDLARETAGLIARFGHRTLAVKTDVSNNTQVENMVRETVSKLGTIDILVNNAGFLLGNAPIHETTDETWDRIMGTNLKGVFLCTRAVLPVMLKQKRGSIINIASVGGILPGHRELKSVVYDVSKGAVITFTRKTAAEYGRDGIRMNAIAPGMIAGTSFAAERRAVRSPEDSAKMLEVWTDRMALGRFGTPDDLKGIAVFLASDASSYATGQVFVIDAGVS
jgi:NAD(P)-dependent dehydrogenase (short-subunit alcohol dehydrogenase family)